MIMMRQLIPGLLLAIPLSVFGASKAMVEGSSLKVIEVSPEASTGLNSIFVVFDSSGCRLSYPASNGYTAVVYRYSNLGGGYAEEINDVERDAKSVSVELTASDMGYIIEDGTKRYYCWVVNYTNHKMSASSLSADATQECDYSILDFEGDAKAITYYTINGQPRTLSREIYLDYSTQEFDESIPGFVDVDTRKVYESIQSSRMSVAPPALCPTFFTLSGDRFLREWKMELKLESGIVQPAAVECKTEAVQEDNSSEDEPSNVIKGDESGLGGSAPANVSFYAYVSDAVVHYEWQMSRSQEFENPEYRFYQQDLDYTFLEEGTYYLRFIGSNSDGSCETFGDVYTVSIGASALECPNAFSPNDDGVNDIWKVSYRSLIDFHCEIFNRNGQPIYSFDDPSAGWDGTWHGRKVRPGVYYYVIVATGADGQKYKKSGDINIINSVNYGNPSAPGGDEPAEPTPE